MGCGISTLDTEDVPQNRKSTRQRQWGIVPPIVKNNYRISPNKKDSKNDDKGVAFVNNNNNNNNEVNSKSIILGNEKLMQRKELGSNDEECLAEKKRVLTERRGKEECDMDAKNVKNNIVDSDDEHEEENKDRDGSFIAMASPSFRDFWINYDSADRSSMEDSNDSNSLRNSSDDDSTNMKNKVKAEENVNCNKEHEKKEGRRRRIRNVMNKGKTKGRRRIINFGCYNASNESYCDGSFNNKIVSKTA